MRLFALIGTLLVLAQAAPAFADTAPPTPVDSRFCPVRGVGEPDAAYLARVRSCHCMCPSRRRHETQIDYLVRTRPICEVHWLEKVQAGTTGGETHEHFLERCGRGCAVALTAGDASLGLAALGLIAAGVAVGTSSNDHPASP